ncbi:sporulation inhibitor of replication protein SirA [Bacillus sp. H-16]|uniref:sporulation inhibitor of replication protein SirA n=1 Tax=Alteribacter salitolerans TaxID=2912333 RepID=UPI00196389E9|nr:sporulation inhibitor of replication protein SirA [Alteribacter salitolerans]
MRTYEIYLINEEVAFIYYGFEGKLFHLFKEHHEAVTPLKDITKRQVSYIQKPYDYLELNAWLIRRFNNQKGYKNERWVHTFISDNEESQAVLTVQKEKLTIKSRGTFEAETRFFDTLKEFDDFFLAVDYDREKYGWLRPLKSLRIVEQG